MDQQTENQTLVGDPGIPGGPGAEFEQAQEAKGANAEVRKPKDALIDAVEMDYRRGVLSINAVAERHGVVEKTVRNWAKRYGWVRGDIGDAVREATQRRMIDHAAEATGEVSVEAFEQEVKKNVEVLGRHQTLAAGLRELAGTLTDELVAVSGKDSRRTIRELIDLVAVNDPDMANALNRVLSLNSRVGALDGLAKALARLVAIERQAHGLGVSGVGGGIEEFLEQLDALAEAE